MTMIGLPHPGVIGNGSYPDKISTEDLAVKAESLDIIEIDGEQYARLPEGWPAAEDKDLEEAHADAVANEEGMPQWERDLYTFTPEEMRDVLEDWSRLVQENRALRKGMKTMQRKTRKQAQVQRRLERRLGQARAGREQLRDTASRLAQHALDEAARALLEVLDKRGLVVREGE